MNPEKPQVDIKPLEEDLIEVPITNKEEFIEKIERKLPPINEKIENKLPILEKEPEHKFPLKRNVE